MKSRWRPLDMELLAQLWAQVKAHVWKFAAGFLLVISVILALLDRVAAGSLVAALFVVVALFEFLPQLESFAAFGIKAKWRKQLDEAEAVLEKLKQSTKASAQLGYYLLGWGTRLDESASIRQEIADQIDNALANLDLGPDTLASFKRDYLSIHRYDLFQTFDAIVSLNIEANKLPRNQRIGFREWLSILDVRSVCHGRIPKADLPRRMPRP